jgi:hypothetical protein
MWIGTVGGLLIFLIVVAGGCAIAYLALKAMKVEIPVQVRNILWVVVVVVVAVVAIKFLCDL